MPYSSLNDLQPWLKTYNFSREFCCGSLEYLSRTLLEASQDGLYPLHWNESLWGCFPFRPHRGPAGSRASVGSEGRLEIFEADATLCGSWALDTICCERP